MALWGVLSKVAVGAANLLFGTNIGGGGGGAGTTDLNKIADKVLPMSERERVAASAADLESAREYEPSYMPKADLITNMGLLPFLLSWIVSASNSIVDALNHAIRPAGFLWLAGGLSGLWKLPDPGMVDEFWQKAFWVVLTFFYGGRTLIKDLPALIKSIRR